MDLVYIPRNSITRDELLGEDQLAKFEREFMIEMYPETVDDFGQAGDLLGKFGLEIKDTATLVVAKKRFNEVVYNQARPFEGDLIFIPISKTLFEINHVEHEQPFYNLGKLHTYKLTVELFTYNNEEFNTGLVDIDRIETDHSNQRILEINDNDGIEQESTTILDDTVDNLFGDM